MSIDEVIRLAIRDALASEMATVMAELGRPRLISIKAAPVAYRAILAAEREGELTVYRVGHASLVDEADLYAWIRRVGAQRSERPSGDEVADLIALGDQRRGSRKERAA